MSTFAARLKELRGAESQASFSSAIGVNRVQYAKYEAGNNSPSVDILARICREHSVSADWLLGLRDQAKTDDATPGSAPQCAKCPYKKKLAKLEALIAK